MRGIGISIGMGEVEVEGKACCIKQGCGRHCGLRCHSGCANGGKGVSAEVASGEGKESKGGAKKVLSQRRN